MQDQYYFWTKMSEGNQTSISTWETTVHTVRHHCSLGTNTEEFMRYKFLFGLNESFSCRFHKVKDKLFFYQDGQRKSKDHPFSLAFEATCIQQRNKLLTSNTIEEQVCYMPTSTLPNTNFQKPPNRSNRPGNNKLCYYYGSQTTTPT